MSKDNLKGWDEYAKNGNSIWPSEHLIRFFNNNKKNWERKTVLEIGCGSGRNSLFLAKEGCDLTITDISEIAINKALALLKENGYSSKYYFGDITEFIPESYNIVIDISSLQHLSLLDIKKTVLEIYKKMPKGGKFFSVTKRRNDSIYSLGEKINETEVYFKAGIPKVYYEANITFLTEEQILDIYSVFTNVEINYEDWTYNSMTETNSHWIITAEK